MQEDSDGPMTRARAKQLQRALTSQIGMIEAVSELKISNQFEIGSRMFICYNWNLEMGKAHNGSFDAGLLEFGLICKLVKEFMLFMVRTANEFEPEFEVIHYM